MSTRQLLWLYVRAWWWAHVPAGPRFGAALWGWLGLAATCALSLRFGPEIWPHTPAAGSWATAGLVLAGVACGCLVLRGLWRWAAALLHHNHGWNRLLVLVLLVSGGALLAGLGLVAVFGLFVVLLTRLG